jgi:hypothetical protein
MPALVLGAEFLPIAFSKRAAATLASAMSFPFDGRVQTPDASSTAVDGHRIYTEEVGQLLIDRAATAELFRLLGTIFAQVSTLIAEDELVSVGRWHSLIS